MVEAPEPGSPELTFAVFATADLPAEVARDVIRVFELNYREANVPYLEKSLGTLRHIAVARDATGEMAGFALGETRVLDLPRLPAQSVYLAGLCCINPPYRRHGLLSVLPQMAVSAGAPPGASRVLACGRTAHPASFRRFLLEPSGVPHPDRPPTAWQQEVGTAVAAAFGSPGFDPVTFVVKGSGVPIGWPVIDVEATPEEWQMFASVDRARGDALLGIRWMPDAPPGWLDP